jgi:hypothetical protein
MRPATPARRLLAAAAVLSALVLTGCGAHSGAQGASADTAGGMDLGNTGNLGKADSLPVAAGAAASVPQRAGQVQRRQVISTGRIALSSRDLTATRTRLDQVVTRETGQIADENTLTNDDGVVTRSHLVVRVPSARFDDTMNSLAGIATLRSSSRTGEDVTTQVIDLHARILAEQAGVKRLRQLVSRTGSLQSLLDVERALTERQGELESLKQQRAYLRNQASQATISVDIALRKPPPAAPAVHAAGGFVGGLHHGWDALVAVVTGVLLAFGAVLPFAIAVALLGIPAWLVLRRLRRSREVPEPAESAQA